MAKGPDKIRYRSAADAAGWTEANNLVLDDNAISDGAFRTYLALRNYARQDDNAFPAQKTLAERRGCSVRSVQLYIGELVDRGLVTVERQGLGRTNIYWLEPLDKVYVGEKGNKPDYRRAQNIAYQEGSRQKTGQNAVRNPLRNPTQGIAYQDMQGIASPIEIEEQTNEEETTRTSDVVVSPAIVDALTAAGITRSVALDLATKHSEEDIRKQLSWLPYRGAKDQAAMLVKALSHGWTAPASAMAAEKAASDRATAAANRVQRQREIQRLQEETSEAEARAEELWALMTPDERERLDSLVMTELDGLKGIPRGGMVWQSLIGSKRRDLLRKRLDDPFSEG